MPELRILWTALPRAATHGHLDVDVFVSPRLGVNAPPGSTFTLADFPTLESWPSQVADHLTFALDFGPGVPLVPATRVQLTPAESTVDLDLPTWQRLLPGTTTVEPWTRRDPQGRPFFSFPADAVTDYLARSYREAGRASPVGPTRNDQLGGIVADAGDLIDTRVDEERPEPTSTTTGGDTIGGGPPATTSQPGCLKGCLVAPLAWLVWLLRTLWHFLTGAPAPPPLTVTGPAPPPISVTPKVVTYTLPEPKPRDPPAAVTAVEKYVEVHGVTPPAGWAPDADPRADPHATPAPTADAIAIASAWRFYRRPETPAAGAAPPKPEGWDFHRRVGALGDYPRMLRRLGIVIRLRVPRPAAAPTSVRVVPSWDGAPLPARDLTPPTHCRLDGNSFTAAPRPESDLRGGGLDLTGAGEQNADKETHFRILTVDTDGAVLKLVHTAASLVRYEALRARGLVEPGTRAEGLASLRTAGIAILQSERAKGIKDQLKDLQTAVPPGGDDAPVELFADDIVRGFQVEVQDAADASAPWRSLCARHGTYHLLDDTGHVVDTFDLSDYGYVKRTAATSADAGSSPLYVHEALVRWTGWSLVALPPGRRITATEGTPQGEDAAVPVPEPVAQLHLATTFSPEVGTLPRLRIGGRYRFRLPWVDLAGNAGERSKTGPASDEVTFRRFEPLAPPSLLPLSEYTPGESLEHLVIRSDIDRDAAHYAAEVAQPIDPDLTYAATNTRHVFPAKVTQRQAEEHGKLDEMSLDRSWQVSLRCDNTLGILELKDIDDPSQSSAFGISDSAEIVASKDDPDNPNEESQSYAINRWDGTLPTPYLPDPLAAAVALRGVPRAAPGGALEVHQLPERGGDVPVCRVPFDFEASWPEVPSFRLRIAERRGRLDPDTGIETFTHPADPPHWDPVARLLTIFLAKGEVASVPFGTVPDAASIPALGAADWLLSEPSPDLAAELALRRAVELGCHWMVSPARALQLVHAVQRPLAPARLTSTDKLNKVLGATVATIAGEMHVHAPTTGHLTLLARWTDVIDDGTSTDLVKKEGSAVLETFAVPPAASGSAFPPAGAAAGARHELGDTKHRFVQYRLRASTRFREYFPATLADTGATDGSDGFSRVGVELPVSIQNSATPDRISLKYLMPSFGWDADDPPAPEAWTTFSRTRAGGGIRVFVDRPWLTSGPGEQIGVVVVNALHAPPELVSQIGTDPTWANWSASAMTLAASAFTGGDVYPGVKLEDDAAADIVGYTPTFDAERGQWYADVSIDMAALPPAYSPFVRLALVRFQPESVEKAHASKAVLAEFAQLAPDRKLEIAVAGTSVTVTVRGRAPKLPGQIETNLMLIALEESDDANPDELGWRPVGSASGPEVGDSFEARLADTVKGVKDGDGYRWERTLTMPGPRGDRTLRVVVRELELRRADEEIVAERFEGTPLTATTAQVVRPGLLPRVVYADAVRLA
jgi:hypothetical protein